MKVILLCSVVLVAYILISSSEAQDLPAYLAHSIYVQDVRRGAAGGGLRQLFNTRVTGVQEARRPLDMPGGRFLQKLGIQHKGVIATGVDGSRHLIHKTSAGTNRGNTAVVTDPRHMSSKWSVGPKQNVPGHVTIGGLVNSAGGNYRVLGDNCMHATKKMISKATH